MGWLWVWLCHVRHACMYLCAVSVQTARRVAPLRVRLGPAQCGRCAPALGPGGSARNARRRCSSAASLRSLQLLRICVDRLPDIDPVALAHLLTLRLGRGV